MSPYTPLDRSLKYWLRTLADHDTDDAKGMLEGLSICLVIMSAKTAEGPRTSLTNDDRIKTRAWRRALFEILGRTP